MRELSLEGQALIASTDPLYNKITLLEGLSPQIKWEEHGSSGFLRLKDGISDSRAVLPLGDIPFLVRFTACHRYEPFWMEPTAGTSTSEVPVETQSFLAQLSDGSYLLIVPLVVEPVRCSLEADANGGITLVAETGDSKTWITPGRLAFVGVGHDPYLLIYKAARLVTKKLGTTRLRVEKPLPKTIDLFGWCTWDAFYQEVSKEKVWQGLQSFYEGGVVPTFLILDDGWLSVRKDEDGAERLTSFDANEKFPGGLGPTVRMAKHEFGVKQVYAWHAFTGYWGGVDPSMLEYESKVTARKSSPGIYHYVKEMEWWGKTIGLVPSRHIYRFFQDFHRNLKQQGIDGVKVDVQSQVEIVAEGSEGRVGLMRAYHEALEGSIQVHFEGNLINCMSLSNDMIYHTAASTLTRTSTDFWPKKPETHGLHLYTNAQNSVWFSEFIHPDWDMFQSAHEAGAFHAAGRAVSGGPVYVSDKPDAHDFDLLKKLILPNGEILRALEPGRPTLDCLFFDTTKEDVLLKIFNYNPTGAVVGAFNARYSESAPIHVSGSVSPGDVPGLDGDTFAVYSHQSGELRVMTLTDKWDLTLGQLGWDIFTITPIVDGFAAIGAPGMLNSGGMVASSEADTATFKHTGKMLAYRETAPSVVECLTTKASIPFSYDSTSKALRFELENDSQLSVEIK